MCRWKEDLLQHVQCRDDRGTRLLSDHERLLLLYGLKAERVRRTREKAREADLCSSQLQDMQAGLQALDVDSGQAAFKKQLEMTNLAVRTADRSLQSYGSSLKGQLGSFQKALSDLTGAIDMSDANRADVLRSILSDDVNLLKRFMEDQQILIPEQFPIVEASTFDDLQLAIQVPWVAFWDRVSARDAPRCLQHAGVRKRQHRDGAGSARHP